MYIGIRIYIKIIMDVIGWDIGIKNLAFCMIDRYDSSKDEQYKKIIKQNSLDGIDDKLEVFEFNKKKYIVLDWNVINVVNQVSINMEKNGDLYLSERPNIKCSSNNIKGLRCTRNAIYCDEDTINEEYVGYCNSHFEKLNKTRLPKIEKRPICYWSKVGVGDSLLTCKTKGVYVKKTNCHVSYCIKHCKEIINDSSNTLSEKDFLKIKNVKKSTSINLTMIGLSIFEKLEKYKNLLSGKVILLENQPVLKNPTMKSVQMFVYSYYIMKGIQDNKQDVKEISCYSASKKNDLVKYLSKEEQKKISDITQKIKDKKGKRKKEAELLTKYILKINNNTRWMKFFEEHIKKDDLSDAMLMSLHYLDKQ